MNPSENRVDANLLCEQFWLSAIECSDDPAFVTVVENQAQHWSWSVIAGLVCRAAERLQELGVESGQNVASYLPNSLPWIALDLACQTIGVVHVAVDVRETRPRLEHMVLHTDARALFAPPETIDAPCRSQDLPPLVHWPTSTLHHEALAAQPASAAQRGKMLRLARSQDPNSPAQILLTSGTIDLPKGVVLSHRNLITNARAKLQAAPQFSEDLRLNVLPFSHAYARTCELSTWILSRGRLAIADSWNDLLRQAAVLNPTLINLVPYLADRSAEALKSDREALGKRLRLLQVGGAALSDELWNELSSYGLPPLQGYGLTEASPVVCSNRAGAQRPGTVGPPVKDVDVKIDPDGVLWTRGPNVMLGYWRDDAATAEMIRDGWLCTGDFAQWAEDGHLRILGRQAHQLVLSTGYQVSPESIESRLLQNDWLEQAVVVGHGQRYVATLVWPNLAHIPAKYFEDAGQPAIDSLNYRAWTDDLVRRIADELSDLPRHQIPRRAELLPEPISVERGTMTRKGQPCREEVNHRFRAVIERLFAAHH